MARTGFSRSSSLGYVSADGVEQLRDLLDDDEEIVETPLVVKEPGSQIVDGLSEARMSSKVAAPPKTEHEIVETPMVFGKPESQLESQIMDALLELQHEGLIDFVPTPIPPNPRYRPSTTSMTEEELDEAALRSKEAAETVAREKARRGAVVREKARLEAQGQGGGYHMVTNL